ncbi:hypothetical protein BMS3Abin04_01570 [bacterium BMS3Abin04]|nr:hypothetical protein BMS3Abin04_01570 [bacterium BMS3Abin04]
MCRMLITKDNGVLMFDIKYFEPIPQQIYTPVAAKFFLGNEAGQKQSEVPKNRTKLDFLHFEKRVEEQAQKFKFSINQSIYLPYTALLTISFFVATNNISYYINTVKLK